jgi:hypothetical protein
MAEPLSFRDLSDKLSDLVADARALEMAVSGASSLADKEMRALGHLAGKNLVALEALQDEVDVQYEAEVKAFQESEQAGGGNG